MRKTVMACVAATAVILAGVTTADAQRGGGRGGGHGLSGGGARMGGMHMGGARMGRMHMGGPRFSGVRHVGGRFHAGPRFSHFRGHFRGHRFAHRRFFGPAFALGVGYPYYGSYAYAAPYCEEIRVRRIRHGRVVWRIIERCY